MGDEMGRTFSTRGERNTYSLLVAKPEGKRPLGRLRRRWVDNIKMDLREIGWSDVDRDQWRDVANAAIKLLVP
jgi:hypothetical protein